MAQTLTLHLVSPERLLMSQEAVRVTVPGAEGDFGVLAGHAPVMAALRPGVLDVTTDAGHDRIFVRGGFAEVIPGALTVLAEEAVSLDRLDPASLARRIQDAGEDVSDTTDAAAKARAQQALNDLLQLQDALESLPSGEPGRTGGAAS